MDQQLADYVNARWVRRDANKVPELIPTGSGARLGATGLDSANIFSSSEPGLLWEVDGNQIERVTTWSVATDTAALVA